MARKTHSLNTWKQTRAKRQPCRIYSSRDALESDTLDANGKRIGTTATRIIGRPTPTRATPTTRTTTVKVRVQTAAEKRRMVDAAIMARISHQDYESGE